MTASTWHDRPAYESTVDASDDWVHTDIPDAHELAHDDGTSRCWPAICPDFMPHNRPHANGELL